MKKIAITQRLIENKEYKEVRETLDLNYSKLVSRLGFLPIVLPYEVDFKDYFKAFKIDGILLSGGNDLNSLNPSFIAKKRDDFEFLLLEYAIENDIPVFGICRGMQVIAKYFNCNLERVPNQVNIRHSLLSNKNSCYFNYLNKIKEVNSFHNFSIQNLSAEFIVSATNEFGMIKAFEHKYKRIFGQMWHSEREKPFCEYELALISNFFEKGKIV